MWCSRLQLQTQWILPENLKRFFQNEMDQFLQSLIVSGAKQQFQQLDRCWTSRGRTGLVKMFIPKIFFKSQGIFKAMLKWMT
jgi:hypothetical protein